MKKRNLAVAMLAAMAMLPMAAPPTQVRAEYKPDWDSIGIENAWALSAYNMNWVKNLDIARQESESEYDYYYRLREFVLNNFTLVQSAPTTVDEASAMGQNKQLNGEMLIHLLCYIMQDKSDIHYDVAYMDLQGTLHASEAARKADMVNEFGQTQTVLNKVVRCVCDEAWRGKGIFGAVKLDGTLYAIRIGTDASDWATLISYADLGCQNCQYDLTWNYDTMFTRKYYGAGKSTLGDYSLEVYNSDGTFDRDEIGRIRWKTGNLPWEVQGVTQYYCENGVITPMTEALHNTLPNNDFIGYYPLGLDSRGARRFIE